jgi:hypothetical protein
MSEAIQVALVTGGLSLLGTIITVLMTSSKTREELRISQAVMETKIVELTREVRTHNGFAQRMPVIEEQIKTINSRLDDLENKREDDLR